MTDIIVVGSDAPTGSEVHLYYGGAAARIVTEDLTESGGVIDLSKTAEYGCVITRTAAGAMTTSMLELKADGTTPATEADGTEKVRTSAAGTATITAFYLDIETTSLEQIVACKDVSSPMSLDTTEDTIHGQVQKLQQVGAAARTFTLEQVDYNTAFMGACFGDVIADSPESGMDKYTDKYTSVKKLSAVVAKQYQDGALIKKWFYIGMQVTKIDNTHPCASWYARSMDFTVDSFTSVTIVPNV